MNVIIEYIFINPELNKIQNVLNNTIKDYIKNYGNSYWERLQNIHNIRFFDKIKNKEKNITNKRGVNRTIIASNGRYEYIEIDKFIIMIEGDFKKNVITTYMKNGNVALLWGKFFLNIMNNRDYIINYCNRPFNKFDKHCREWYLIYISDDNEIRIPDNNLIINHMVM